MEVRENQAPRYLKGLDLSIAFIISSSNMIDLSSRGEWVVSIDFDGFTLIPANL